MLCVVFTFVSLYFGSAVNVWTPSENIHPKHAGGQVPGNRAPVPGCVLRVELRRVSRFRVGCSIADGSSILQLSDTFHPKARVGIPVKRIRKDPHQGISTPSTRGDRCPESGHLSLDVF